MAEVLAGLYWKAHIDANDIEFVLAPASQGESPTSRTIESSTLGGHALWILDFDCYRYMPYSKEGVEQAVTAFFTNDPFFPRPWSVGESDRLLWEAFKTRFLSASKDILGSNSTEAELPALWIRMVEERARPGEALSVRV